MGKSPDGPKTVIVDGEEFDTVAVAVGSKLYTLRGLSVGESDEIDDATREKDGTFNSRLNMRLALAKAIISPTVEADAIAKWPSKKYVILSRALNKLNDADEGEAGKN